MPPQPPDKSINLLLGHPHPTLFPTIPLLAASTLTLSSPNTSLDALSYGPALGHPPLRHALCQWLTSFYQPSSPISVERICITGGASQNLGRILEAYSDVSYTRVWMGVPGYFLAGGIFADHGFAEGRMKGVPEDKAGEIDTSWLGEKLRESDERDDKRGESRKPVRVMIFHPSPSFLNSIHTVKSDSEAKLNLSFCENRNSRPLAPGPTPKYTHT